MDYSSAERREFDQKEEKSTLEKCFRKEQKTYSKTKSKARQKARKRTKLSITILALYART